jgi:imidazolonepropionase-like amidohydrolase
MAEVRLASHIAVIASVFAGALAIGAACVTEPSLRVDVPDRAVVLSGASVYLGDGRTLDDALVILDGERIAAVLPRPRVDFSLPAGARVYDLHGKTILPGLVDLHTHLGADGCFTGTMGESRLRRELRADLSSGVTTVLDLGSLPWLAAERIRSQNDGWDGPEILLAGPMITAPGGHPTAAEGRLSAMTARVSNEKEARLAVARIADGGADVIKAVLEPGGYGGMSAKPSLDARELAAIAEEAHARGLRLFVHVSTVESAKMALDAGADVLAHVPIRGKFAGTDLPRRLAAEGIPVLSTLSAFEGYYRLLDEPGYLDSPAVVAAVDPEVLDGCRGADVVSFADGNPFTTFAREQFETARQNIAALRAAGAPLALGTDSGNLLVFHGPAVRRELTLLVTAGLSPSEAIDAATERAADALGRTDLGAIRPGRRADLLVVDGNPAQHIEDLDKIEIVIRAGRFYDRAALAN